MDINIWNLIKDNLSKNQVIKNWTIHSGYSGDDIIIREIKENSIDIEAPNSSKKKITFVSVPKSAFEELFEKWDSYLNKEIDRGTLRKTNWFSRYVINILNYLETKKII